MLFLSVPGSQTTQDRTTTRDNVIAVLPSSLPERSRHPDPSAFRSSIARPTDTSVYASSDTSRYRLQDSRPGWIRCFLSCRALSSPTTCRFIPALSVLPTRLLTEDTQPCQQFVAEEINLANGGLMCSSGRGQELSSPTGCKGPFART